MKVQVLKPFGLAGKEFLGGTAEVPEKSVQRLIAKGLIAVPGEGGVEGEGSTGEPLSATPGLGNDALEPIAAQISAVLGAERSSEESPLEFLQRFANKCQEAAPRIIAENDRLGAELEQAVRERDAAALERDEAVRERDEAQEQVRQLRSTMQAGVSDAPANDATPPVEEKPEPKEGKGKGK